MHQNIKKALFFAAILWISVPLFSQDLADLFDDIKKSVVTIYVQESVNTGTGDPRTFTANEGLGSGVLIDNDSILTASHVVANADKIMVQFFDGEAIPAVTSRISRRADVAVITFRPAMDAPKQYPMEEISSSP